MCSGGTDDGKPNKEKNALKHAIKNGIAGYAVVRRLLVGMLALLLLGLACAAGLMGFVYYKETHLPPSAIPM